MTPLFQIVFLVGIISGFVKLTGAGHKARSLVQYIAGGAFAIFADLGFGVMRLKEDDLPWSASALRESHGNSRACEVRHVIFSTPPKAPTRLARQTLQAMSLDWLATYAPGRHWLAGFQNHNGLEHLHLAVQNIGSSGDPIYFHPKQVAAMPKLAWTKAAVPVPLTRAGKIRVYTKAKNLVVKDLAGRLIDSSGRMREDWWRLMLASGEIAVSRRSKHGRPITIIYEDRPIRVQSLRAFVRLAQEAFPPTKTMKPTKHPGLEGPSR